MIGCIISQEHAIGSKGFLLPVWSFVSLCCWLLFDLLRQKFRTVALSADHILTIMVENGQGKHLHFWMSLFSLKLVLALSPFWSECFWKWTDVIKANLIKARIKLLVNDFAAFLATSPDYACNLIVSPPPYFCQMELHSTVKRSPSFDLDVIFNEGGVWGNGQ